jgi:hypothetical protein
MFWIVLLTIPFFGEVEVLMSSVGASAVHKSCSGELCDLFEELHSLFAAWAQRSMETQYNRTVHDKFNIQQ